MSSLATVTVTCVYCGRIPSADHGVCEGCGAPLRLSRPKPRRERGGYPMNPFQHVVYEVARRYKNHPDFPDMDLVDGPAREIRSCRPIPWPEDNILPFETMTVVADELASLTRGWTKISKLQIPNVHIAASVWDPEVGLAVLGIASTSHIVFSVGRP